MHEIEIHAPGRALTRKTRIPAVYPYPANTDNAESQQHAILLYEVTRPAKNLWAFPTSLRHVKGLVHGKTSRRHLSPHHQQYSRVPPPRAVPPQPRAPALTPPPGRSPSVSSSSCFEQPLNQATTPASRRACQHVAGCPPQRSKQEQYGQRSSTVQRQRI